MSEASQSRRNRGSICIRARRCKYSRKRSNLADGSELTRLMRLPPNDNDAVCVATNHLRRFFSQELSSHDGRFFDLVVEIVTAARYGSRGRRSGQPWFSTI